MPISSIQYRLTTENYQRQSKLILDTERKISKKCLECIQSSNQIIEIKNSERDLQLKTYSVITVNKQNKLKTTLLLLILINQVCSQKNELLNNTNKFLSLPELINKSNSSSDITKKIPQNISSLSTNSSLGYKKLNLISIPMLLSTKQSINKTRTIRSNYFFYKMTNNANKKLSDFLEERGFLDSQKKYISKIELTCTVFKYLHAGKIQDNEIAAIILSSFYPEKKKDILSYPFLSNEHTEKILSDWFFKNILGESPAEHVINVIANNNRSLNYTINDMIQMLSLEKNLKERGINLKLLPINTETFLEKIWFQNLQIEMPFLYFWYKDKNMGTISLQDFEFSNLYTGAQFLYNFNILDKFNEKAASKIGKTMWDMAIKKGIDEGMEAYFWTPAIIFEAEHAPEKIRKLNYIHEPRQAIIREQLKYRQTVQQFSRTIQNDLDNYKISLIKWSNKKNILDRAERNKVTTEVINSFSILDKNLILFALASMKSTEINFIFSSDTIIRPISFTIYRITRKHPPIITPTIGKTCFYHDFKPISCVNNRNILKPTPNIKIFLEKIDLFSVQAKNEEHIYALKDETHKYKLVRVDRDISKYVDAGILDYKSLNVTYSIHNNQIVTQDKILSLKFITKEPIIKGNITKYINFLVNTHSNNLFNSSFQTNSDSSTLEKSWDIFKHFIPFYDCANDLINKGLKSATPICLLDIALFTPVSGSKFIAEKFGLNLAKTLYKNSIYLEGNEFTKNILLINKEKQILFKNPEFNFEILENIDKKYTNKLLSNLKEDKKTISLSQKLKNALSKTPISFFPDSYTNAHLPNSKITVFVIKATEKEGQDVYTILDPKTGNSGWVHYTMKENKELVPLKPFPKIKKTKQLKKFFTPDMYAKNINIDDLSSPDYYRGLRWDHDHRNAYLSFRDNFLKIKILDTQPFLVLKNRLVPLIYKNNKLGLENLSERLRRLQKVGLSGRNLLPKQIIANKLNISEEEALTLLNKYEFPETSKYYTDKSFALWIQETGQIPQWSDAFKKLNLENLSGRFINSYLQNNNLYCFSQAEGFAYRVDSTPPDIVLRQGFAPSHDYTAIKQMINSNDIGLIVSGDITGALRYNTLVKSPYIYKIALENTRGVSLKDNLVRNPNGLKLFLEEDPQKDYKTIESLAQDTNGAIYLDEMHLYYSDIKIRAISLVGNEEIQQAEPLFEGPWKNYF